MSYEPIPLPHQVQLEPDEAIDASQQFLTYMQKRHSVRDYADTPVPKEVIEMPLRRRALRRRGPISSPGILWPFKTLK